MTKRQLFNLIAGLKNAGDAKDGCLVRTICFYEDVARALLPIEKRTPPDPVCVKLRGSVS